MCEIRLIGLPRDTVGNKGRHQHEDHQGKQPRTATVPSCCQDSTAVKKIPGRAPSTPKLIAIFAKCMSPPCGAMAAGSVTDMPIMTAAKNRTSADEIAANFRSQTVSPLTGRCSATPSQVNPSLAQTPCCSG